MIRLMRCSCAPICTSPFDKPRIALVPKPATDGSMRLVAHLLENSPELEYLHHNRELHTSAVGVDMLYARFAWSVFTLLDAFLECKIDRRLALRATDARLFDARGFVTAVDCELFSTATTRKRSQSPKKRKPERDTVTEYGESEETAAGTGRKRRLTSQARTTSPAANPAKRPCWDPSRSLSISEESSSPSPPTPTHSFMTPQLEPFALSPPSATLLAQSWLENDRQRSDPDGKWDIEHKWAIHVWDGRTLASDEVGRWFEACGVEFRDV
jgi:hypothetical protein